MNDGAYPYGAGRATCSGVLRGYGRLALLVFLASDDQG